MSMKTEAFNMTQVQALCTCLLDDDKVKIGRTFHEKILVEDEKDSPEPREGMKYLGVGIILAVNGERSNDEEKYHFYAKG